MADQLARYPGKCCACGGRIFVGDPFHWGSERGQRVHTVCPEGSENGTGSAERAENGDRSADPMVEAPTAMPAVERDWSDLQRAIFARVLDRSVNVQVKAAPGSSKTTTSVETARRYREAYHDAAVCMVAFNASSARDFAARVPAGVVARTDHSLWKGALEAHLGARPRIDGGKLRGIVRSWVKGGQLDRTLADQYATGAVTLVGKAKAAGIGVCIDDTPEAWIDLLDQYDVSFDGTDETVGIELAQKLLAASNDDLTVIDFDDMLYLSALFGVQGQRFDLVIIDEAQDFNAIQRHLLERMLRADSGRLLSVGDENQSIYAFRGAASDSMARIREQFACEELPLSISYRCAQAIVRRAQQVVSDGIQAAPNAPEGSCETLDQWDPRVFTRTDVVLCRNTAPLVGLAYRCLAQHIPVRVLGREIGAGLITLIEKMRAVDLDDLQDRLDAHRRIEVARLVKRDQDSKAQALSDKIDSIEAAIAGMRSSTRTVAQLIAEIESVFSDSKDGVLTLSTVHKAKGQEWDRVFILDAWLMPSKYARKPEQQIQERNVEFVAVTRARRDLYFISSVDCR